MAVQLISHASLAYYSGNTVVQAILKLGWRHILGWVCSHILALSALDFDVTSTVALLLLLYTSSSSQARYTATLDLRGYCQRGQRGQPQPMVMCVCAYSHTHTSQPPLAFLTFSLERKSKINITHCSRATKLSFYYDQLPTKLSAPVLANSPSMTLKRGIMTRSRKPHDVQGKPSIGPLIPATLIGARPLHICHIRLLQPKYP